MFEWVISVPEDDAPKEDVKDELVMRRAISAISKAEVKEDSDGFAITIKCRTSRLPLEEVSLYPIGCEALETTLENVMVFDKLELSQLTEFYVIKVGNLKRVIKIDTTGLPTDARDQAIFRSIINTKSKFISYLSFMLTDDPDQYILESQQLEKETKELGMSNREEERSVSLYEDLVRMAYKDPERVSAIRKVIGKLDKSVIPERFNEMYASFENAIKQIRRL